MNVSVASKTVHYVCRLYRNQYFWNRCHIILPAKPTKKKHTLVPKKHIASETIFIFMKILSNLSLLSSVANICKRLHFLMHNCFSERISFYLCWPWWTKSFFRCFWHFATSYQNVALQKKGCNVYCVPKSNCIILGNSKYVCFIQNPSTTKATTPRFTFGSLFKWVAMPTDTVVYNKHKKIIFLPTSLDKVRECKGAKRSPPPKVGDNMKPPKVENVAWRGRV